MKKCDECKYALLEDYGYSNYTVEGTYVICLKKLHPDPEFDRWYGEEEKLNFAEQCSSYTEGLAFDLDCDHEEFSFGSDVEVNELVGAYLGWTGQQISEHRGYDG